MWLIERSVARKTINLDHYVGNVGRPYGLNMGS
jgi:hypothetical protein